ncbi:MAG: AAA family ATPase [Desulfobacteraceae bacterium]|nr:MAG: AAA family ATPase [Desulfobacteraceae bacterium]
MAPLENPRTCMHEDGLHLGPARGGDSQRKGEFGDIEDLVETLRIVLDNVYSGIIVVDKHSKILYMNRFYADLLKTDREGALGRHIKEFFPDSRLPGILRSGEMELGRRCSLRAGIALLVNRIPIKREGETIGVILQTIFKDYTEINELMARLNMLEREVTYYKTGLDSMLSATFTFDDIVGGNKKILEAKNMAEKYARTDSAVLIEGPTGTGKELFAHAVHTSSERRRGPFVCVNCAAIPKELLESELFGYETGAFTGARQKGKPGKIELAHKGTLFLDEIGDLPLSAQSKILRVLETRRIEKLGGIRTQDVDFRLVAATNRDLKAMISRKEFREDLYYRLNTMTIEVPPLAQRADDIPVLVGHFLQPGGRPAVKVSDAAMDAIQSYSWPGNVRELKNAMDRAMSLAEGRRIEIEHLPYEVRDSHDKCRRFRGASVKPLAEELACHEKDLISETLRITRGNMSQTAKLLGISRSTLYEKCKAHGF